MNHIKNHKKLLILFVVFLIAAYILINIFYFKDGKTQVEANKNAAGQVDGNPVFQQVDINDLVDDIKSEYKKSATFKECIGQDIGIKTCLRREVNNKILETGDPKYCADFPMGEKESCLISYANKKATETGDASFCENLTENDKQNCSNQAISVKAKKEDKISLCDTVSEDYKNQCRENLIIEKVRKTLKISDCDVLEDLSKDMCRNEIRFAKDQIEIEKEEKKRFEKERIEIEKEEKKRQLEIEKRNKEL